MTWQCPTCGHTMQTPTPLTVLESASLAAQERRIIDLLIKAHPRKISKDRLTDLLYCYDPDGGPVTADKSVAVLIHRIRRKIKPYGWTIPYQTGGRGVLGRYTLAPYVVGGDTGNTR
jgi:hypothetical protein